MIGKQQAILPISVAVIATVAALFYAFFTFQLSEEREAEQNQAVITAIFNERLTSVKKIAFDYSYWQTTIDEALIARNEDWADNNIGSYLIDTFDLSNTFLLSPKGETVFSFGDNGETVLQNLKKSSKFETARNWTISQPRSDPAPYSYYDIIDGEIWLTAISALTAEEDDGARPVEETAVLVLTRHIDSAYLKALSALYRLHPLHYSEAADDLITIPLRNPDGTTINALRYHDDHTLLSTFGVVLLPLAIILLSFLYFVIKTLQSQRASLQLTEELNVMNQSLEEKVRLQTRDLLAAKEKAEENSQAKSVFLSNMSHEFRTPLNGILGFAQMIKMNRDQNLTARQQEWIDQIMQSGKHLLSLVNDVLDLARIESGKLKYEPSLLQPREVFKECHDLLKPLADKKNITLKGVPETDRFVYVDRAVLKQTILNLLNNAVKYGNEGGHVQFGCRGLGSDRIEVYIRDNGIGIAPQELEKIFDPFHRAVSQNSNIEGTGVGLSIVKRNVDLMEGEINVTSTLGEGSCFIITLPARTSESTENYHHFDI